MPRPIGMTHWDWPSSKTFRKSKVVGDHLYWSYAMYHLTNISLRGRGALLLPKGRSWTCPTYCVKFEQGNLSVGSLEQDLRDQLLSTPRCAHCGAYEPRQVDHLIPVARGGRNMAFNLVPSCGPCNSSKGDTELFQWYRGLGRFPTISLLRHYLRLCLWQAKVQQVLHLAPEWACAVGFAVDVSFAPSQFPPMNRTFWGWDQAPAVDESFQDQPLMLAGRGIRAAHGARPHRDF